MLQPVVVSIVFIEMLHDFFFGGRRRSAGAVLLKDLLMFTFIIIHVFEMAAWWQTSH